ncbi:MAG TPA: IPT/TIG domain-containing protein, partial [Bryobacteraceae bacterium]|nr:IPT/TIG domain-containing protein [Bryobacteraceae bacterium]
SGHLPVTPGAYETQFTASGCQTGNIGPCFITTSGFLTKFNPQGTALVFSTYVFENLQKQLILSITALAAAPNGDVYFASGFGGPIPSAGGIYLMNASGSAIVAANTTEYATIAAIALGADGNVYVTGATAGPFTATPNAFQRFLQPNIPSLPYGNVAGGGSDAFVVKYNGSLSKVLAATLLGGESVDSGASIAFDASGNVIIGGSTGSVAFPVRAPFQTLFSIGSGFVAGFDPTLSQLLFSTYLGDTRSFSVAGAAPDGNGNLLVAGTTNFATPGSSAVSASVIVNKIALLPVPAVRLDSVVNYASRLAVPLSPGEAVQAMGSGFSASAKLLLDGNPIPTVFANSDRIVAIIPADAKTSGSVQVTVSNNGAVSNAVNVPAALASPGIYSIDNSGFGQGYILNSDGTRNSQSNPAKVGSSITILATGVGPLSHDGIYAVTEQPVSVFIDVFYANGIAAFTKHVSGLPGDVYEISVTIPDPATLVKNNPDLKNFKYPPEVAVTLSVASATSQQGIALWLTN